jgi:hypothetical protein
MDLNYSKDFSYYDEDDYDEDITGISKENITFMNDVKQEEYVQRRKDIFENDIMDIYLMIDSFQSASASTFTYSGDWRP